MTSKIITQKEFIEYLNALAPEGETALIVRQKPILHNRELQNHADGALRCTWSAYLPSHPVPPNTSYYGNTGSFILDRFKGGKPSASIHNATHVLVMVLDDIGTAKCKTPALPPTWIMETSPRCFQWGYVFSEQPTTGEFTAAIRAIADAGYTDPGACNAVRNFRLPGSVNLKPGRDGWASVLTQWSPDVEYALAEICNALDVTPGVATVGRVAPVRLADTGCDEVLAWLNTAGMVLSSANALGWHAVVCPNHGAHSDGQVEARYHPIDRGFCCYHGHCAELTSQVFLDWVAAQGGPDAEHGLRNQVLVSAYAKMIAKISPGPALLTDPVAAAIAEVDRREAARLTRDEWHTRFAYVQSDDAYFDLTERKEYARRAFDAIYRHVECKTMHHGGKGQLRASAWFDEHRHGRGSKVLDGITYAAGETALCAHEGELFGNRWRDARPVVDKGVGKDVRKWIAHCELLVPDAKELAHIWDVMAFKLQHPGVKINHAILHTGTQRCGKDTMWAPFFWAVCGPNMRNFGLLDLQILDSSWGYVLESEIVVINELKESGGKDSYAFANRLKPLIAAPPEMLSIRRKGLAPYDMANRLLVLAFSNEPIPLQLEASDQRWMVVHSYAPAMRVEDSAAMWQWYLHDGGYLAIAAWLYARDVSAFMPGTLPLMTDAKENLIDHGRSGVQAAIGARIAARSGEFASGVVGSPFHDLCDRLAATLGYAVPRAALLRALADSDWIDCGRVMSREYGSKKHVFCSPEARALYSNSDLRRMCEPVALNTQEVMAKLKVIK